MQKILVTGFEPFDGEPVNPAWESVQRLDGKELGGYQVFSRQVPTVFYDSVKQLRAHIEEADPDIVICVGQAGGRSDLSIERIAINVDDAGIPDNAGQQPVDTPFIAEGPAAYFSTLPIKAIVQALLAAGVPASVSQTAGTYVCNHIFYGLMHVLATEKSSIRGGFIHIPFLPEQIVRHPGQPSMSVETLTKGLEVAIEATIFNATDVVLAGGAIS